MKPGQINRILRMISDFVGDTPDDLAVTVELRSGDPWRVLVSTILSLRARDETTAVIGPALLKEAPTPLAMSHMQEHRIAEIIRTGSFYKTKAKHLHGIARDIVLKHEGRVPNTIDELLGLKGIGRKSANLILTHGFSKQAICVDTHVHRISNRLGFVDTKSPAQTEQALIKILPQEWWIPINGVLIAFGRKQCTPISPKCPKCPVRTECRRIGVKEMR